MEAANLGLSVFGFDEGTSPVKASNEVIPARAAVIHKGRKKFCMELE